MKIGITNTNGTFYATLDINTIEEVISLQNEYGGKEEQHERKDQCHGVRPADYGNASQRHPA